MFGLDAANRLKRRYRKMISAKLRANDIPGAILVMVEFKDKVGSKVLNKENKDRLYQKLYKYAKKVSVAINDSLIPEDNDLNVFKIAVFSNDATDKVLDKIEKIFKTQQNTLELVKEYENICSVLYVHNNIRVYMAELALEKLANTEDQLDNADLIALKKFAIRECLHVIHNIKCERDEDMGNDGTIFSTNLYDFRRHPTHLRAAACLNKLATDNSTYKNMLIDISRFISTELLDISQLESIESNYKLEASIPISEVVNTPEPTDSASTINYFKMLNNAATNIYLPRNEAIAIDKKIIPLFFNCIKRILSRELKLTSEEYKSIYDMFSKNDALGIGRFNYLNYKSADQPNVVQSINCMDSIFYLQYSSLEEELQPITITRLGEIKRAYEYLSNIGFIPPDISPAMSSQEAHDYFAGMVKELDLFINNPTLLERLLPGSIPKINNLLPNSTVKQILFDAGLSDDTTIDKVFLPWLEQQGDICEKFLLKYNPEQRAAIEAAMLKVDSVFKGSEDNSVAVDAPDAITNNDIIEHPSSKVQKTVEFDLDKDQIRSLLIDEMKSDIISTPVLLNGRIYDKAFIYEWFNRNPSDPLTRAPFVKSDIKPCPWLIAFVKFAAEQYNLSLEQSSTPLEQPTSPKPRQ